MPRLAVQIRFMVWQRDVAEVMAIESQSFEYPWTVDELLNVARLRNCTCLVAEHGYRIVGYLAIQRAAPEQFHILSIAVHPDCRGMGVGEQLIHHLKGALVRQRMQEITVDVRERNVDAQLFFRSQGFKWFATVEDMYEGESDEDGYVLLYELDAVRWTPKNRISKHVG